MGSKAYHEEYGEDPQEDGFPRRPVSFDEKRRIARRMRDNSESRRRDNKPNRSNEHKRYS